MKTSRQDLLVLALLVVVGGVLRFWQLDSAPPGMTHDEAAIGFFVRQVAEQTGFVIDAPYGYANEPLTKYSATPWFWAFGATDWTLRAHQAAWGLLGIVAAWAWAHAAFNRRVALGAAALMAVSYWPLTTSRMALNSNPTPALVAAAGFFLFRALGLGEADERGERPTPGHWLQWAGFALALGLSLFTYEAARATAGIFPVFLAYLVLGKVLAGRGTGDRGPGDRRSGDRRSGAAEQRPYGGFARLTWGQLGAFAAALVAGLAIGAVHLLNPAAWGRTGTLSVPLTAARNGDFGPLVHNVLEGLGTLFVAGDPFVVYNLPGRANLDWVLGALLVVGVAWCVWFWRRPAASYTLLWLGTGLVPTLVIGAFTAVLHSIAAQVVILALPVIGADALISRLKQGYLRRYAWLALAAWIGIVGLVAAQDYFNVWNQRADMRAAYFANFGDMTNDIAAEVPGGVVAMSSAFPDYPHDPLTYAMRVQRDDVSPRWFDGRHALVLPDVDEATLLVPVNAPLHERWLAAVPMDSATRVEVSDAIDPYYDRLDGWQPRATLAALQATMTPMDPPTTFGGAVTLVAWDSVVVGNTISVYTLWKIDDPAGLGPREVTEYDVRANIFLHVLNGNGEIAGQQDRLDAPASAWVSGEHFVQVHEVGGFGRGDWQPRVGIYRLPAVENLRTPDGAEFVLLPWVRID